MALVQRIAVYSIADLKNTTDDAIVPYLKGQKKFVQSNLLSDVRLALGYSAVAIAALIFYLDYTRTWPDTKSWTGWAVGAYFILNSILTIWIWLVENGNIFVGSKGEVLLGLASHVEKYEPFYRLKVRYTDYKNSGSPQMTTTEVVAPFTRWFTLDGQLVGDDLYQWLDSVLPSQPKTAKATI